MPGHYARRCPEIRCHTCFARGHIMRDCKVPWLNQSWLSEDDYGKLLEEQDEEKMLMEAEWRAMKAPHLSQKQSDEDPRDHGVAGRRCIDGNTKEEALLSKRHFRYYIFLSMRKCEAQRDVG